MRQERQDSRDGRGQQCPGCGAPATRQAVLDSQIEVWECGADLLTCGQRFYTLHHRGLSRAWGTQEEAEAALDG